MDSLIKAEDVEKETDIESTSDEDSTTNFWWQKAQKLYNSCSKYYELEGEEPNPYFLHNINLSRQLLNDFKLLPLWSSIYSTHFNFGRDPASSASVESEMNKFKNVIMKKEQ